MRGVPNGRHGRQYTLTEWSTPLGLSGQPLQHNSICITARLSAPQEGDICSTGWGENLLGDYCPWTRQKLCSPSNTTYSKTIQQ